MRMFRLDNFTVPRSRRLFMAHANLQHAYTLCISIVSTRSKRPEPDAKRSVKRVHYRVREEPARFSDNNIDAERSDCESAHKPDPIEHNESD